MARSQLVYLFLFGVIFISLQLASADRFTVGDRQGWNPNVNYTVWVEKRKPFHVGDWLGGSIDSYSSSPFGFWLLFVVEIDGGWCDVFAVFYYQSGMADVVQVDEAGYNKCDASNPISNYSKGRNYAFQLNHTGRYYFICSRGYCYGGMRLAILAERLPPPSPPSSSHSNSAARCRLSPALLALAVSLLSAAAAALFYFHL
ncbi:hypothetical protein BHE74_00030782 [Ensete ventricosum]|nr:hypothetical protein BHE74_00030782 [Ensete ventricosum]RZS10944.1 hypothetical protein BHM03_00042255 [Ensete ventricosum]